MAERWVGPSAAGNEDGTSWADRYGALNDVEDNPVAAGDIVHVGPGVYRELLTVDVSGGNTYVVGTVSLTNGSKTVTGSGTTFTGNVFATAGWFHVLYAENGTDGVTAGDNSFTSAGADFDAGHAGMIIQINTKGAYKIATVTDANTLVLSDPSGLGWPTAGDPLTWSIMSGQGHYSIASVDGNTQLTLDEPWQGPTLDGLSYLTFQAIEYIADVTGGVTDGVGGVVRITGSDNDQTTTRNQCISASGFDYRVFRGSTMDLSTEDLIYLNDCEHVVLEDLGLQHAGDNAIHVGGIDQLAVTIRRAFVAMGDSAPIYFYHTAAVDDSGHVFENSIVLSHTSDVVVVNQVGGGTVRNCFLCGGNDGVDFTASPTLGQALVVTQCVLSELFGAAFEAATLGEVIEDYNTLWEVLTAWVNVAEGGNSVAYPPLFVPPVLLDGFRFPWQFGALSEWSPIRALTGWAQYAVGDDLFGIMRPTTAAKRSWGPIQFVDWERATAQAQGGSVSGVLSDAGEELIFFQIVENASTTFTLYVYRESNYAGTNPQMIIRQPGQADQVTTDVAASGQWNQLSDTFTPAVLPAWVAVYVKSNNTAAAGNYKVYVDTKG